MGGELHEFCAFHVVVSAALSPWASVSAASGVEEPERRESSSSLTFLAGLSGVWERDEAGLDKGEELRPLLFQS